MFNRNKQSNSNHEAVQRPAESQQAVVQSAESLADRNHPNHAAAVASASPAQATPGMNYTYQSQQKRDENSIAILVDEDNGIEYYMETIDIFAVDGRLYVAMFPVPEKKQTKSPQLVLLRMVSGEGQAGQTMYESIRDKSELARVFDAFFARYENSLLSN